MSKLSWKELIKRIGMRALKTTAQTAVAIISTSVLMCDVNWIEVISASLLSGILAILTFIANLPEYGE